MNTVWGLCLHVTTDFFFSCSWDILLVQLHRDHKVHVGMDSGQCCLPDMRILSGSPSWHTGHFFDWSWKITWCSAQQTYCDVTHTAGTGDVSKPRHGGCAPSVRAAPGRYRQPRAAPARPPRAHWASAHARFFSIADPARVSWARYRMLTVPEHLSLLSKLVELITSMQQCNRYVNFQGSLNFSVIFTNNTQFWREKITVCIARQEQVCT